MCTFRIHSSIPDPSGRIPYATLSRLDQHCVQLCLEHLNDEVGDLSICLSMQNLYMLLEGKSISVELPCVECLLAPEGRQLLVDLNTEARLTPLTFRLELAELALAWNLIAASTAAA